MNSLSPGLPDPDTDPQFYADVATKRLIAWVIDTLIIALVALLCVAATLFLTIFLYPAIFVVVHLAYRTAFIARSSATPGMRLMAIELRNRDGARLAPGEALLHTLAFSIISAFVLPQLFSVFLMASGRRGQGLHDHLLGTTAINRPATRL